MEKENYEERNHRRRNGNATIYKSRGALGFAYALICNPSKIINIEEARNNMVFLKKIELDDYDQQIPRVREKFNNFKFSDGYGPHMPRRGQPREEKSDLEKLEKSIFDN